MSGVRAKSEMGMINMDLWAAFVLAANKAVRFATRPRIPGVDELLGTFTDSVFIPILGENRDLTRVRPVTWGFDNEWDDGHWTIDTLPDDESVWDEYVAAWDHFVARDLTIPELGAELWISCWDDGKRRLGLDRSIWEPGRLGTRAIRELRARVGVAMDDPEYPPATIANVQTDGRTVELDDGSGGTVTVPVGDWRLTYDVDDDLTRRDRWAVVEDAWVTGSGYVDAGPVVDVDTLWKPFKSGSQNSGRGD